MLPVRDLQPELIQALASGNRCVVEAPTGSGKSTQIPQMILDSGTIRGQIIVLQPRRMAARMLARRVAAERSSPVGQEVGYRVRFDTNAGPDTRILYETDGVLLRNMIRDPSTL